MILVRTQYSLNKDRQRPKWQPQKSWTENPDFQDVQVKQLLQYPLFRRSKWKMHQRHWEFQSVFGYVYQSTNDQNHGPVWKIQWQDCYGKGNLIKFYRNTVEKSFRLGMFICQPSKRTVAISVRGRYQTCRQDREHRTDSKNCHGWRWPGRTNIIPWPRTFGLYSKRVYNK